MLKKRLVAARPGGKQWVTFRFFYRTQESINQAGFTKAPKTTRKNMLRWTPPAVLIIGAEQDEQDEGAEQAAIENDEIVVTQPKEVVPDLGSQSEPIKDVLHARASKFDDISSAIQTSQRPQDDPTSIEDIDLGSGNNYSTILSTEKQETISENSNSETGTIKDATDDSKTARGLDIITGQEDEFEPLKSVAISRSPTLEVLDLTNPKMRADSPGEIMKINLTPEPKGYASRAPTPSLKRKGSTTPVPGTAKKMREENNAREVVLENMRKQLAEKKAWRIELQEEAEQVCSYFLFMLWIH
jgi:cell division septation protein DedD